MAHIVGVIAEYNPFHNGHAYHLSQLKKTPGTKVVVVMSGNFTQRGQPAAVRKELRARAALTCGADLVLELPFPYAFSRARDFAAMGVGALDALGFVGEVNFGSECGELGPLMHLAEGLESPSVTLGIKEGLGKGLTFAKARRDAAAGVLGGETAALLDEPNNTLAIEYLLALKALGSSMRPGTVKRYGAAHDSESPVEGFASASFLRELWIREGLEALSPFVPPQALPVLREDAGAPYRLEKVAAAVLWKLRQMGKMEFAALPDVAEGLENRLWREAGRCADIDDFLFSVKTKRYTLARLRRILLCAVLGIRAEDLDFSLPYLKILGFTPEGEKLLALAAVTCKVPLLSKGVQIEALGGKAAYIHRKTAFATDFFSLMAANPMERGGEYRLKVQKVGFSDGVIK